jgi:tetratricopeptide (TPR) repeat protein/GT2 family glycosyltransferase
MKMKHEMASPLTSIVILTYNQLDYTKRCILSIFTHTWDAYELIVVDNGSTDGTVDFISSLDCSNYIDCRNIKLIANPENAGFARGCNQGLSVAEGRHLLLLNNDVVVTPGWLSRLHRALDSRHVDMVGPMSNHVSGPQRVEMPLYNVDSLEGLDQFAIEHAEDNRGRVAANWRLAGFCLLFGRWILDKIGGLDERYSIGNFEDDDFCLRVYLAGFKGTIAKECYIHHFGGQTFIGNKIDYNKQLMKNWELFKKKWNIPFTTVYGAEYQIPLQVGGFDTRSHCIPIQRDRINNQATIKIIHAANDSSFTIDTQKMKPLSDQITDRQHQADKQPGGFLMSIYDQVCDVVLKQIPKNDHAAATWILERIVEYSPHHGKAHHELGLLYYEQGEMAKAQSHLHQAVRFSPTDAAYFKDLGDFFHVVHKDVEQALHMYEKAVALQPNDSGLLLTAAHFYVMEHRFDKAREYYQRVLDVEPANYDARMCIQQIENRNPSDTTPILSSDRLYSLVQTKINSGDVAGAIPGPDQILRNDPGHAKAHFDRGRSAHKAGDADTALHHYEKAAALEPDNLDFIRCLADFYWVERKDARAAMEQYVHALRLDSEDLETLLNCGRICMALEKNEDALEFFARVQEIDPWNEAARRLADEANDSLHSDTLAPENDNLYQQAQANAENGRFDEAIDCMLQLLIQSPQNALYHNDIGVLYYKAGDKEKALACYEQAVQLEPRQTIFRKNLADFYLMEQGRAEDAMQIYVRVLEDDPQDIDCLLATGLVCLNLNKMDDARAFFERVLEIEPWNHSALQAMEQLEGNETLSNFGELKRVVG